MAGFFTGVTGLVSTEAMEKAVKASVPKGTEDLNMRALRKGLEFGQSVAAKGN
jgi:2-oxoglutarate ferredoxin oxidoreductase subunit gamma